MISLRRLVFVTFSWVGLVSAICLARLFSAQALTSADLLLIFLSSIFAGAVIGELEGAIMCFATTLPLSVLVVGLVLYLPAALGPNAALFERAAENGVVSEVFQAFVPFTLVLLLLGSLIGSAIAERFGLD